MSKEQLDVPDSSVKITRSKSGPMYKEGPSRPRNPPKSPYAGYRDVVIARQPTKLSEAESQPARPVSELLKAIREGKSTLMSRKEVAELQKYRRKLDRESTQKESKQ